MGVFADSRRPNPARSVGAGPIETNERSLTILDLPGLRRIIDM
jgi:hypothetical protein